MHKNALSYQVYNHPLYHHSAGLAVVEIKSLLTMRRSVQDVTLFLGPFCLNRLQQIGTVVAEFMKDWYISLSQPWMWHAPLTTWPLGF